MQFIDEIKALSKQCSERMRHVVSEEATKNSLVLPFIRLLGYDYHDPTEVVPEFTADMGTKRGEKVDYALMNRGNPAVLIECKTYGSPLGHEHVSQLLRYFTVTEARIGILTDGISYRFFSDLDQQNVMDREPFFEFNLIECSDSQVEELTQFRKSSFDVNAIVQRATRLKHISVFQSRLSQEFSSPSDEFVRFLARPIHSGSLTQKFVDQYRPVVAEAFIKFIDAQEVAVPDSDPHVAQPPAQQSTQHLSAPQTHWANFSQILEARNRNPPTAIRFSKGETRSIKSWAQLLVEVAEWLVRDGHMRKSDLPIDGGGRRWSFINSAPLRPDGREFRKYLKISGGIYLEMNLNANSTVIYSKRLLDHFSIEHETVELRLE